VLTHDVNLDQNCIIQANNSDISGVLQVLIHQNGFIQLPPLEGREQIKAKLISRCSFCFVSPGFKPHFLSTMLTTLLSTTFLYSSYQVGKKSICM
jgi:hypothetical protein